MIDKTTLDQIAAGDFDKFRENYSSLSFEQLKQLYTAWYTLYPVQAHFNANWVEQCLNTISRGSPYFNVVELGGYQGELAAEMLPKFNNLENWINLELIPHSSVCMDRRYQEGVLHKPLVQCTAASVWLPHSTFIASDTLEHFTNKEFVQIIRHISVCNVAWAIVKIPLRPSWHGAAAAHLLTLSKESVDKVFVKNGWTPIKVLFENGVQYYGFWARD